jgi:PAS domain S-box-containing protein
VNIYGLDITERKQAEEEVKKYRDHLEDLVQERTAELTKVNEQLTKEIIERKRMEKALQESEDKFRRAFEYAALGMVLVTKTGRFLQVNQAACTMLGYSEQEMFEKTFQELTYPEDLEVGLELFHNLLAGKQDYGWLEKRYVHKDGHLIWALLSTSLIRDSQGVPLYLVSQIQNITERKQAEQALLKNEQQYRTLAEHVADGIGIAQAGKFVFANQALCSILGYPPDQLLRIDLVDLFRHDYQGRFRETLERLEQGVLVETMQAPCVTGDGQEIWTEGYHNFIEWEGKPAILVTLRDITKRKLRELEIEEARERLHRENIALRTTIKDRYKFGEIIGKSPAMQELYELIAQAATTDANVLIMGESGTGKELVARTIHRLSNRGEHAFVPVNCGAIPETLFESEFFGHRKGAFTGADRDKTGFFDGAHKGTLFLDEVGELTPTMQVKLLRALETGEYTPVGVHTPRQADVRIIAATNKNLTEQRQKGLMREDFFYRIDVVMMTIPPLRKRKEDLPLLIEYFLDRYDPQKTRTDLPGKILEALRKYDWPGNIRELQNVLQRYLTVGHLHFTEIESEDVVAQHMEHAPDDLRFYETLEGLEKRLITQALERHHWHRSNAAAALGIPRRTLHRKMKKLGLG